MAVLPVTDTGICSLHLLLQWADKRASPGRSLYYTDGSKELQAQVEERTQYYGDYLGPATRRLGYHYLLQDTSSLFEMFENSCGPTQARLLRLGWPLARKGFSGIGLSEKHVSRARDTVYAAFDDVANRLQRHKQDFIVGDRLTAADISFAALAAPVLLIQEFEGFGGGPLPRAETVAADGFEAVVKDLRSHPAGQFALRAFRYHRGTRQIPYGGAGKPPSGKDDDGSGGTGGKVADKRPRPQERLAGEGSPLRQQELK